MHDPTQTPRRSRLLYGLSGLLTAGAVAATAHGLFEVSVASRVPPEIAWIYPGITDGLALVAYGAAHVLTGGARVYAWFVVALSAGLSGLAQAFYLAGDAGAVILADPALRFVIGAWPAVAAAVAAHLLYLIREADRAAAVQAEIDRAARKTRRTVATAVAERQPAPAPAPAPTPSPAPQPTAAPKVIESAEDPAKDQLLVPRARKLIDEREQQRERARAAGRPVPRSYGRGTLAEKLGVSPDQARLILERIRDEDATKAAV